MHLMIEPHETSNSCIVVVDPQRDFEQNGSLCVSADANLIYDLINKLILMFEIQIASQDYHGSNHISFVNVNKGEVPFVTVKNIELPDNTIFKQLCWPVHCVKQSNGVRLSESFKFDNTKLRIVRKGIYDGIESYSAVGDSTEEKKFERTLLIDHLIQNKIVNVYLCGLAFDHCVGSTALDLAKAGFVVYILTDCTRYIFQKNADDITNKIFSESALLMYNNLVLHGVNFITSENISPTLTSIQMGDQILPLAYDLEDI